MRRLFSHFAILVCGIGSLFAVDARIVKDIEYARIGDLPLLLDLHLSPLQRGPLILWVHGGAWRSGSKSEMPVGKLVEAGWPVASVEYRLSPVAKSPAQIHDIKAAIRFLRRRGSQFGIHSESIVVAGASAGGHLAALVGVSNGHKELEGDIGEYDDASSAVQGVISFFGGANLTTILSQSTPHGLSVRVPALKFLLGDEPGQVPEAARLASPVFHVDKHDPPLLLFHGDQDAQMPINQAHELDGAYKAAGGRVRFEVIHGAGHGGKVFYDDKRLEIVKEFLNANFSPKP